MRSYYDITHYKNKDNYVFWDFGCHEFLKLGEDEIPVISAEEGNNIIAEIARILENPPDDERIIILDSLGSSINVKQVENRLNGE